MFDSQPDDVLVHIFTFISPISLCLSCSLVNSRWSKLIHSSTPLWLSWDKHYPFLLPHPSIANEKNLKGALLIDVQDDTRWKKGRYTRKEYFEAHKGTMMMNMSLCDDLIATSANDHLVKLWKAPVSSQPSESEVAHDNKPIMVYSGHTVSPKALHLSESVVISGGMDYYPLVKLGEANQCQDLWFSTSSSSTLVNTHDKEIQVWDLNPVSLVTTLKPIVSMEFRELRVANQTVFGMDRHSVFEFDLRASAFPTRIVAAHKGIVDCLEYDGEFTIILNTADEVKFFDIRTGCQTQKIDSLSNLVVTTFLEGNKLILGEDPVQIRAYDIKDVSQPLFTFKTSRTPKKVRSHNQLLVCGYRSWGISVWEF